jgi:hypothetical protein
VYVHPFAEQDDHLFLTSARLTACPSRSRDKNPRGDRPQSYGLHGQVRQGLEIDILADPARLRQLDPTILDD